MQYISRYISVGLNDRLACLVQNIIAKKKSRNVHLIKR